MPRRANSPQPQKKSNSAKKQIKKEPKAVKAPRPKKTTKATG